jgi:hypothetical protein
MKFASCTTKSFAKTCVLGMCLLVLSASLAVASPVFTWDPSGSNPPLSGAGSAFSADTAITINFLHALIKPDGSFDEEFVLRIEEFQLGDQIVTTPGLNSTPGALDSYGLYFTIHETGQMGPGGTGFNTLDIALMGDPGNNNGTLAATTSGIAFGNSGGTGIADDIPLGIGTLVSAMMRLNPVTGVRSAHFVESFQEIVGQAGFFVTPLGVPSLLEQFLTTPPSAFAAVPQPDGTTVIMVNGGTGRASFIPEPSTLVLLAGGGLILGLVRRRNERSAPSLSTARRVVAER